MSLYDSIAELPFTVDSYSIDFREQVCAGDFARISVLLGLEDTALDVSGFKRPCTRFSLRGAGVTGVGEDVTYDIEDHLALIDSSVEFSLEGTYTIESFSETLDAINLFPASDPVREASRAYRRWAVESAALDLALKQADTNLALALGREYNPVRFLVSTRLGDPPKFDRLAQWLELNPDLEFKLDATSGWTANLIDAIAATDTVRIIDLKGQYTGTMVDQPADSVLYRRIIEAFPDALIEDPILTDETRPLFEGAEHRISWDALITDVESIQNLPFTPDCLNIKPSRFGTLETLFDVIEYCLDNGIQMYGGGQTELSVGRQHIHALASLFYPEAPNDTAPRAYNEPEPRVGLPTSPLTPPLQPHGLEWYPRLPSSKRRVGRYSPQKEG